MNISELCRNAVLEHGVLMNGDAPAGRALMEQPVLRVALIENTFPAELMTEDFSAYLERSGSRLGQPDAFPAGIEEAARRAIGYWHEGEVQFVSLNENPDIRLVAYNGPDRIGGFATYPLNDDIDLNETGYNRSLGFKDPVIAIDMRTARFVTEYGSSGATLLQGIESVIRHEFGHSLGLRHPELIMGDLLRQEPAVCSPSDVSTLKPVFEKSHMAAVSAGPTEGSEADTLLRQTVRGANPNPATPRNSSGP